MILVHLVQVDMVFLRFEQLLADGVEVDARVTELPLARCVHIGTKQAGDELMAEADTREVDVGTLCP